MDYLNYIHEHFPIRRKPEQKSQFQQYAISEAEKLGKEAKVEINNKHQNIVFGDVENAKVVFTAHYDTPCSSLVPNLMLPRNPFVCYLYHFGYPVALAMLALLVSRLLQTALTLDDKLWAVLYIVLYLGAFWLATRTFTNKHNKNDNTSGVAAVMSIMAKCKRDDVAYILFDNEEKGLLGSKAYSKAHKDMMEAKLVFNLDCIGVGEHFITIANPDAEKTAEYELFKSAVMGDDSYQVLHCPKKGSMANSDHKNFKCGVGVVSCKKNKAVGYYTSKIHTNNDTEAYTENIEFISDRLCEFADKI